jgi:hypothetical protein
MKKYVLVLMGTLVLVAWGCERSINFPLPYEGDRLVVNALFNPDTVMEVEVSQTVPALTDTIPMITNASVRVYADDSLLAGFVQIRPGTYQSVEGVRPRLGVAYRLEISADGFDPVFSEPVTLLAAASFGQVRLDANEYVGNPSYHRLRMCRDTGVGPFLSYQLELYRDSNLQEREVTSLPDLDTASSAFTPGSRLFDDQSFGQATSCFYRKVGVGSQLDPIDTVYIRLASVSDSYYRYQAQRATRPSGLGAVFSRPDSLITNLRGGYGIFGIEQVQWLRAIAE